MNETKVIPADAALLVRALGLLINQAGIYGPNHNVTQRAARSVFIELERMLETYKEIEIAVKDKLLFVNGDSGSVDAVTAKNLSDRMDAQKVEGLVFLSPPDMSEFLLSISLFGMPPVSLAGQGGFDEALKRAGVRSIKTVAVNFQRVEEQPPQEPEKKMAPAATDVLDLSAALKAAPSDDTWGVGGNGKGNGSGNGDGGGTQSAKFKEQAAMLASFLRDTAQVLESNLSQQEMRVKMKLVLERIRAAIEETTTESEQHITTLADQVNEDKQKIDSLENAARRRGIGLKLSRHELVERYAELNQEIVQPLTVSSGVLDLLYSGKGGQITDSQKDLLKLASDSVARVNQLVAYMNRVTGLPESFMPDSEVIRDSYR